MIKKISLLGLGAMGSRIAKNLIEAGFELTVYNRTIDKTSELQKLGAKIAKTPKEAAEASNVVVAIVTNDEASKHIWLDPEQGALLGMDSSKIAVESSTLSLDWTLTLTNQITSKGYRFLEAPVVGSRPQTEAKQLVYLVGGNQEDYEKLTDFFAASSGKALYLGEKGNGTVMKLVINSLFGIQAVAFSEMFSSLEKFGYSRDKIMKILPELAVTSPIMKMFLGLLEKDMFDPLFPIDLVEKDFGYAEKFLNDLDIDPIVVSSVRKAYQLAQEKGYGNNNISGVIQIYRDK